MIFDGLGRLLTFFLLAGPDGEAKGALVLMDALLPATVLLGNKGNNADWLRVGLENEGIAVCIPTRRGLRNAARHDRKLYKQRHRIERLFARLKDQRSIASLFDKCGELFPSAICIVGTVAFRL